VTRLTRMALFDAALFAGLVLAMRDPRWQTVVPQDPALSRLEQTPDDATVASTRRPPCSPSRPGGVPDLAYPTSTPPRFPAGVKSRLMSQMGENYWSVAKSSRSTPDIVGPTRYAFRLAG
jgi:hypothetical protein